MVYTLAIHNKYNCNNLVVILLITIQNETHSYVDM